MVLVHGTRFDARQWAGYADLLPECDVVTVDLPGHGTRVGEQFTLEAALAVIDTAVKTSTTHTPAADLEPKPPVVLAGHSLGGYLAAEYARRHPERIAGLGLIGAAADPTRHPRLAWLYKGFAALLPVVGADRMARFANGVFRGLGVASDALPGAEGYRVTRDAWAAVMGMGGIDQVRELDCPVLVVSGQWDQLRIDARRYAGACPSAWVVTVPRATHVFPLTHPQQLACALRQLVARSSRTPHTD